MRKEYDDIGEDWLKENDPEYGNRAKAYYLNSDRSDWVNRHELPSGSEMKSDHKRCRDMRQWLYLGSGNYKKKKCKPTLE